MKDSSNQVVADVNAAPSLSWTYSPVQSKPWKVLVALGAVAATAVAALILFHSPLISLLSGFVVFAAISEALLPLTYHLDPSFVTVKIGPIEFLEMPTESVKSVYLTDHGVKLSAFAIPKNARMEPFRGVLLRYPRWMSDEVLSFLSQFWKIAR